MTEILSVHPKTMTEEFNKDYWQSQLRIIGDTRGGLSEDAILKKFDGVGRSLNDLAASISTSVVLQDKVRGIINEGSGATLHDLFQERIVDAPGKLKHAHQVLTGLQKEYHSKLARLKQLKKHLPIETRKCIDRALQSSTNEAKAAHQLLVFRDRVRRVESLCQTKAKTQY